MIDFYLERQQMEKLRKEAYDIAEAVHLEQMKKEIEELTAIQHTDSFWQDVDKAQEVNRRLTVCTRRVRKIEDLLNRVDNAFSLMDIVEELDDENEIEGVKTEVKLLERLVEEMQIEALLNGKYDSNNAILSLHAGAGGTEAQDWVEMLYRMYVRYAERSGYCVKELDKLSGDEAGIKSVTFLVSGENAYGYLKAEMGVHRLVRISPFDANKRRHTSFASLEVMPEISEDNDIKINQEDLRIDTYRSGGAGGQHINKTDSAVRITHIPTGIVVQCQNERSQIQNRETAMKMLIGKLIELRERERLEEAQAIKGELKKIEWGSQIRSYVFCPYTLVKDHRTNYENTNVNAVMDGDIGEFIIEYLKRL